MSTAPLQTQPPAARLLLTALSVPASVVAGPLLGAGFTVAGIAHRLRCRRLARALVGVLNVPFDLLMNSLGWLAVVAGYPAYAGTEEHPSVGMLDGSLVFKGGPAGHLVGTFASAFTPTSVIYVSGRAWSSLPPEGRDRLLNHELWHARRQFGRYTGWVLWPSYLVANLVFGVHERNPFESGRNGPYTNVDRRWDAGYRESPDYVPASDPFWF
ncbi:MAG: hypothetical protein ACRDJ4_00005 [Actinomycetota bacterium]